jgi:benzil reductase ((S)-benzoin forming)
MKYAVVTGASKGLGSSIAERVLREQFGLVTVSRNENLALKQLAAENGLFYKHVACNLTSRSETEQAFSTIAELVFSDSENEVLLVNNAGVVEPIDQVGHLDHEEIEKSLQVNVAAPMYTTNLFIQKANGAKLTVVNVTSGAAERPVHGWSVYCSTKAALNMFTKTVAVEQGDSSNATIIGYSPGIMDTDMQGVIRSSTEHAFQEVHKFIAYKENGMLRSTSVVADALIDLLLTNQVENGKIYSVNNLLQ